MPLKQHNLNCVRRTKAFVLDVHVGAYHSGQRLGSSSMPCGTNLTFGRELGALLDEHRGRLVSVTSRIKASNDDTDAKRDKVRPSTVELAEGQILISKPDLNVD